MADVKFDGASGESGRATRLCGRHAVVEAGCGAPLRAAMEQFVQTAFAHAHGAEIHTFMPTLLGLCGQRRSVCAVAGFRLAGAERLYLENYLDLPAEAAIAARTGARVSRSEIVEVGNLAGASCRAAIHLVALLPRYLMERNQRWIVFTATRAVRTLLQRFEAPVFELGAALRECVANAPDAWGHYYDSDPRVMAGFIPEGLRNPAFARALL